MRYRFFIPILSILISISALSQNKVDLPESFRKPILEELKPFFTPSEGQTEDLLKGDVISVGKVTSPTDKEQQMMLFTSGIHPRNCTRAMRKLSLYENYHQYIDFIKKSRYDEKKKEVYFEINHALLPYPMVMRFKIPRITKDGHYPFTFEHGFLKNLKGNIGVKSVGKFCLLTLKADWRGPETPLSNLPLEVFIQTVGRMGLEHLIRVSLF